MKARNIIISLLACGALFTSCTDFLEEKSNPNYLTPETFWQSEADIDKGLTAAYAYLQPYESWAPTYDRYIVTDNYRSDELIHRADVPEWLQIATFTNNLGNYVINDEWENLYIGISYCNQCITNIPNMEKVSEKVRNSATAEARCLRAFYYFRLYMNFGDRLPLYTKQIEGKEEEFFPKQEESGVIEKFITDELSDVQQYLPESWDEANAGRVTKYTAAGLLAKYYMFTKQPSLAKPELAKIVDSKKFALLDNYADLFDGHHKNSKESIFEIQFTGNMDGGHGEYNLLAYHFSPWGYEEAYPSQWLFETMKADKTVDGGYSDRMYATILFNDPKTTYFLFDEGEHWSSTLDDDAIYWHKFNTWDKTQSRDWFYSAFNFPLIRYADVLLLYAECLNDEGQSDKAVDYINMVRNRSKVVPLKKGMSKAAVLKHLQDVERPCELALEGTRWYDLLRWGITKQALTDHKKPFAENYIDTKYNLYPIPHGEFLLNPDWVQNPNFSK